MISITSHFNSPKAANVSALFRRVIADDRNLPELLLPQTDLFGARHDDTWKDETPEAL